MVPICSIGQIGNETKVERVLYLRLRLRASFLEGCRSGGVPRCDRSAQQLHILYLIQHMTKSRQIESLSGLGVVFGSCTTMFGLAVSIASVAPARIHASCGTTNMRRVSQSIDVRMYAKAKKVIHMRIGSRISSVASLRCLVRSILFQLSHPGWWKGWEQEGSGISDGYPQERGPEAGSIRDDVHHHDDPPPHRILQGTSPPIFTLYQPIRLLYSTKNPCR